MGTPFIGEIRMFGFGRTPQGWQACDGSLLQISEYEPLYLLLGTTYGGNGTSTFGVPDLRGRLPIHQGQGPGLNNYVLGQRAGTETVTLVDLQMPSHTHTAQATTAAATAPAPAGLVPGAVNGALFYVSDSNGATALAMSGQSTSYAGGSQPHQNVMPTLTVQYCIATTGIFPQQA
ncbi:phage tail protein [Xanthomonas sp. A2111]|uniref:Tail fiber protein n=1 Tax=Xanthomonas hawaiiensis TaxID=3003247 RepID=A0ABU2I6L4_9XANT|nr:MULTISPECIES: tail fiber protein [unclassified Xanthomonas]MBO9828230.1 phage tail protein [Xanthomonas sp. A2111]MBO9872759.1 phage tail protein [Xanthomonas sp. D-93]MDS9993278.1 tail fiber protein [Xanthomonas sp. A2111]WNH45017.1 tail fiber protein [Xanthomonas sp. A6251]